MNINRLLNFKLPSRQSAFLWGPRKTGKSTFLRQKYPKSFIFDFLDTDLYINFIKKPSLLRQRILAMGRINNPVILDEVQKVPAVLDEVHWLLNFSKPKTMYQKQQRSEY